MADADSLNELGSDLEQDSSAVDGDVEDDDASASGIPDASLKRKNKKKKRKPKDIEKSSGDSDTQMGTHGSPRASCSQPDGIASESTGANDGDIEEETEDDKRGSDAKMASVDPGKLQQIQRAVELLSLNQGRPRNIEEASRKTYQFWDTQPVPKINEKIDNNEAIEADKPLGEVRQTPFSLPTGFHWDTLDLNNNDILKELYTLLNENYVEDDDNMFRFDYSPEFLKWALQPPGWLKEWHCGVRVTKSGKLIGFIGAVPAHMKVYSHYQRMVEINFLCVHKRLRAKRVAPVLIKEITRRVNKQGIFQAVYTAGVVLPKPVATCRYWHRSLNPRKLIDVKFSHLSRNMTMQRTLKLYKLPDATKVKGFRKMVPGDIPKAFKILTEYLNKFDLSASFTLEEFRHWFTPQDGIVDSFVVENGGDVTDFVSFYTLPSTVMHHPQHKMLKAAYSFYNVSSKTPWVDLLQDALTMAKQMDFDVFNALDLMDNKEFLEKLKFGIGDGNLQYYLYNWRCPGMKPEQVGLVLQ